MFTSIKTFAVAATIGLTGLVSAAPAHADSIYFGFGDRGGPRAGVVIGDNGPRHWDRRYDRDDRRYHRNGCSPDRAIDKAYRMGLERVRVTDVSRHTITVRGRDRGDRVRVTFARERGCPIIG